MVEGALLVAHLGGWIVRLRSEPLAVPPPTFQTNKFQKSHFKIVAQKRKISFEKDHRQLREKGQPGKQN